MKSLVTLLPVPVQEDRDLPVISLTGTEHRYKENKSVDKQNRLTNQVVSLASIGNFKEIAKCMGEGDMWEQMGMFDKGTAMCMYAPDGFLQLPLVFSVKCEVNRYLLICTEGWDEQKHLLV